MKVRIAGVSLLLTLVLSAPAHGAAVLFNLSFAGGGGSISFSGATGDPLLARGIAITSLSARIDGPGGFSGVLACSGCQLALTTGAAAMIGPPRWAFGSGGNLALTGDLFAGPTLVASGLLASGTFGSRTSMAFVSDGLRYLGVVRGSLHVDLAAFLGAAPTALAVVIRAADATITGGAFSGTVGEAFVEEGAVATLGAAPSRRAPPGAGGPCALPLAAPSGGGAGLAAAPPLH